MRLSPLSGCCRSKAVVLLLLLIRCWLLLPLWDSVIVLCFVCALLCVAIILMGKRELVVCFVCLPGVSWLLCGSSSRYHGFVCSLWLCYILIIITYYFWARTWELVHVLWRRLKWDCSDRQACQSPPCLHNCAKISFEPEHETWYMCCEKRLRQDCANVKTCQGLPCLHKCAKITIWASTWDLVLVLWRKLRRDCANVQTCQSLRCSHKLRQNRHLSQNTRLGTRA